MLSGVLMFGVIGERYRPGLEKFKHKHFINNLNTYLRFPFPSGGF